MGDAEYITVMQNIILPIAYEFCPELVLVSAGFDAAVGDPLGGKLFSLVWHYYLQKVIQFKMYFNPSLI